jgi:hypothetical protein
MRLGWSIGEGEGGKWEEWTDGIMKRQFASMCREYHLCCSLPSYSHNMASSRRRKATQRPTALDVLSKISHYVLFVPLVPLPPPPSSDGALNGTAVPMRSTIQFAYKRTALKRKHEHDQSFDRIDFDGESSARTPNSLQSRERRLRIRPRGYLQLPSARTSLSREEHNHNHECTSRGS